jgi:hypothetical protein
MVQEALNIVRLKGLGFSLEEKIRSCHEQLRLLTECRDRLSAMITLNQVLTENVFSWRIFLM